MTRFLKFAVRLATTALALTATVASAALAPDVACEVGKLKVTASYASCLLKAQAKGVSKMLTPDFTKCEDKINSKFPKLEEAAGPGVCPSEGDLLEIRDITDDYGSSIAILLSGGTPPTPACGDGTVDLGESCDLGNLDGRTCVTEGFAYGTLACSPGCTFDTAGCHLTRFEDNVSTVHDYLTGLEWEKKNSSGGGANLANPHDADNTYSFAAAASTSTQSGTLYSDFLFKLNGVVDDPTKTTLGCFANHCDWRVPTVDELQSILVPGCGASPCVQDVFLLPNSSGRYWSNSTNAGSATGAYFVDFLSNSVPLVGSDFKTAFHFARAVRTAP